MALFSWKNLIIGVTVLGAGYVAYSAIYDAGYNTASLEYEQDLNELEQAQKKERLRIEDEAYQAGFNAAEKVKKVETVYEEVEKEVIKYVTKTIQSECDTEFVSEWVRLHNQAANPGEVPTTSTKSSIDDSP